MTDNSSRNADQNLGITTGNSDAGIALAGDKTLVEEEIILFHEDEDQAVVPDQDITDELTFTEIDDMPEHVEETGDMTAYPVQSEPAPVSPIEELASEIDSLHTIAPPQKQEPEIPVETEADIQELSSEVPLPATAPETIEISDTLPPETEDSTPAEVEPPQEVVKKQVRPVLRTGSADHDYDDDPDIVSDDDYVIIEDYETAELSEVEVAAPVKKEHIERPVDERVPHSYKEDAEDEALGLLSDEELSIEEDEVFKEEFTGFGDEEPFLELEEVALDEEDHGEYTPLSSLEEEVIGTSDTRHTPVKETGLGDLQEALADDERDFVLQEIIGIHDVPLGAFTTEEKLAQRQQRKINAVPSEQKPEKQGTPLSEEQEEASPPLLEEEYFIPEEEEVAVKPVHKKTQQKVRVREKNPVKETRPHEVHAPKVVLDIPDNIRKELPRDFAIEPIDLYEAEMVANENILFKNEDELLDELNKIHLRPLREVSEEEDVAEDAVFEEHIDLLEINDEIADNVVEDDFGAEEIEPDYDKGEEEVKDAGRHQEAAMSTDESQHDEEIVTLSPDELFEIDEEEVDLAEPEETQENDDIRDDELYLEDIDLIDVDSDILDSIYDEEDEAMPTYFLPRNNSLAEEEKSSIEKEIESKEAIIIEEDAEEIEAKYELLQKRQEEERLSRQQEDIVPLVDITERIVIIEDEKEVDRFIDTIPDMKREDMRKLLSYLDGLFEKLPEDVVRNFAESEYFELYSNALKKLGL